MPKQTTNPRHRRDASFRRQPPQRQSRKLILIVCEGEQTEYIYFDRWRRSEQLSNVTLELKGRAGQDASVVEAAKQLRDRSKQPFDEVWAVFDREGVNETTRFQQALANARRWKVELAISNPSFEYWLLLHFESTDAPFTNAAEVLQRLRTHLPRYAKNTDVFDLLHPQFALAMQRAEQLHQRCKERDADDYPSPCTTVYALLKQLLPAN